MSLGLKQNARNPSAIANMEFNDAAKAQKCLVGTAGDVDSILADSTVTTPLEAESVLRIANTANAVAYIYVGKLSLLPGALSITTALAIMPYSSEVIFAGTSDDDKDSIVVKSSAATVQVAVLKR
jgi:hypothetical protein